MSYILFLDDDPERHRKFRTKVEELGYPNKFGMLYVFTANDAIAALKLHSGQVVQAFLDHDLSEEDVMIKVGESSKVPTGMTVVDYITAMNHPPDTVVVHSMNHVAACEMSRRLSLLRSIAVKQVPFHMLMFALH